MERYALVISFAALTISALSFVHNRATQRRALLLDLYSRLLTQEQQLGRRIVFQLREQGRLVEDLKEEEHDYANHALSTMNIIGFLYDRSYVPQKDAMQLWGRAAYRLCKAAEESGMLALRDGQEGNRVWPYFRSFAATAERRGMTGR